jgi:hypothetical protein
VDGWLGVFFILLSCLLRSLTRVARVLLLGVLYIHPYPGFVFWIVLHPLRFELAVGRGRDVRTVFFPPTFLFFACIGIRNGRFS